MSVPSSFRNNVIDWVAFDKKVDKAKVVIEKVKKKKDKLSKKIAKFVVKKNIEDKDIKIANTRLYCTTSTRTTPLTQKFIKECTIEYLQDANEANELMKILKDPKLKLEILFEYYFEDEEKAKELVEHIYSRRTKTVRKVIKKRRIRDPHDDVEVEEGPITENAERTMDSNQEDDEVENDEEESNED